MLLVSRAKRLVQLNLVFQFAIALLIPPLTKTMHWTIAAPFVNQGNIAQATWLDRHVPGCRHQFTLIPRRQPLDSWHERKSKFTSLGEWVN